MASHIKVEKLSAGKKAVKQWRRITPKQKVDVENYSTNWLNKEIIPIKDVDGTTMNKFKIKGYIEDILPYKGQFVYKGDPDNKFKKIKRSDNNNNAIWVYGFEVLIKNKKKNDEIRLNIFNDMGSKIIKKSAEEFAALNEEEQDEIVEDIINEKNEYIFCVVTKISNIRGKGYILQEIETAEAAEETSDQKTEESETWKTESSSKETSQEPEEEKPKKKKGRPKKIKSSK